MGARRKSCGGRCALWVFVVAWVVAFGGDCVTGEEVTTGGPKAEALQKPTPRVTVGLRVVPRNETLEDSSTPKASRDVAVLSINDGGPGGNKSLTWGSGSVGGTARKMPLPIVTVASRLLDVGMREEDPETRTISSLAWDPQPKSLEFDPVPPGDPYKTDTTHAKPTVLAWAGALVSVLQPQHFPIDLVRSALERKITAEELVMESLQAEPGFIAFMGVGLSLAVGVPLLGMIVCCCRMCGRCGGKRIQHHHDNCFNCQRKSLTTTLATLGLFVSLGVVVAAVSNERLSGAVWEARTSVQNNVDDLDTFLRNTKMQLRFLVSNSLEQTVDAIYNDLDDVDYLLGRPLQKELAAEAQIEVALDSLLQISSSLRNIAGRMRSLEESRSQAAARAEELKGRLAELSGDIQRFITRCTPEDMELCNSLDYRGLDLDARFDSFSFSEQLRLLSAVENHNLSETARHARYEFENIPNYVEQMTRGTREEVKRAVRSFRANVYSRVRGLDDVAFDLEVRTRDITWRVDEAAATLQQHEGYRWYTGLAISISLGLVWLLITVGLCCGCSSHTSEKAPTERSCVSNSAGQTLLAGVFFMFLFSSILWVVVVALFVIGAHAHAFICHPLYEEPGFSSLSNLLDHSGMVFQEGSMLSNIIHPGRDVHLGVGEVLSQCKDGGTAYQVFKLRHYFDIESEIDVSKTFDLRDSLGLLKVNLSNVELLSPEAEANLDRFLRSIKLDLTPYRREMDKPLVRKNLPALAEQMQNVAGQLRSVAASAELFKMVARTRNIISNTLYPLEKRKEDVTYQIATLDMEVMPLQRQINQSSGHLRTIQYFIHSHGSSLAAAKVRGYVERILGYTRQYTDHVRNSAFLEVAPCTPVWNLFDSARGVTCNGIIEPLNALWLATCWCLLLFLPAIMVSLALARFYLRMDQDDDTLPLHSNGSPPGSTANIQGGASAALWGPKSAPSSHHHHGYPSRHHNGAESGERPSREPAEAPDAATVPEVPVAPRSRFRRRPRLQRLQRSQQQQRMSADEVVAGAQVAAWRDAWKAGAGFVTLELVARHVHRPIDWVHQHWHDDPRVLATSLSSTWVEHTYSVPTPASQSTRSAHPCHPQPDIVCWGCCHNPDSS